MSLDLIKRHAIGEDVRILDVGGGSSRLADCLLTSGFRHVGVLDISARSLEVAGARLGDRASSVEWLVADVAAYEPSHPWDVWHDRAVFHFLLDDRERQSYVRSMRRSLEPNGIVVVATFGPDGPDRCSGLDVERHTPETLCNAFGSEFNLVESHVEMHQTPDGKDQQFVYCVFHRAERRK